MSPAILRARDLQREETRRRVYEAALQLFRARGFAACSVDEIARRAGVSHGAFYFHFPAREDVLKELLAESEARVVESLAALPERAPLAELLAEVGAAIARDWERDRRLFVDVAQVALRVTAEAPERSRDPVRRAVAQRFESAAARGELTPAAPAPMLADLFLLNQFAVALAWCTRPQGRMAAALQGAAMLFLHGAAAPRRR